MAHPGLRPVKAPEKMIVIRPDFILQVIGLLPAQGRAVKAGLVTGNIPVTGEPGNDRRGGNGHPVLFAAGIPVQHQPGEVRPRSPFLLNDLPRPFQHLPVRKDIPAVQEEQKLSLCMGNSLIHGIVNPGILFRKNPDLPCTRTRGMPLLPFFYRTVPAAAVLQNNLKVPAALTHHTVQGRVQLLSRIQTYCNNRKFHNTFFSLCRYRILPDPHTRPAIHTGQYADCGISTYAMTYASILAAICISTGIRKSPKYS